MEIKPLVSVICLCYNQEKYVKESLFSVINQSYHNIEIIVLDDCSSDKSSIEIQDFINKNKIKHFIQNDTNLGICKAFNKGLVLAKGKYIIDFACDDIMQPDRIEKQVEFFERLNEDVAFIYSNAEYFFDDALKNYVHFSGETNWKKHSGWVYKEVLKEFFIPTATVMYYTDILKKVGGYDEKLSYEDFDIWVRLSREYQIVYQDLLLTKIRRSDDSMSSNWYKKNDPQAHSAYLVCKKAQQLNRNKEEVNALIVRVKYEIRMCFLSGLKKEITLLYKLLKELNGTNFIYFLYYSIGRLGLRIK